MIHSPGSSSASPSNTRLHHLLLPMSCVIMSVLSLSGCRHSLGAHHILIQASQAYDPTASLDTQIQSALEGGEISTMTDMKTYFAQLYFQKSGLEPYDIRFVPAPNTPTRRGIHYMTLHYTVHGQDQSMSIYVISDTHDGGAMIPAFLRAHLSHTR